MTPEEKLRLQEEQNRLLEEQNRLASENIRLQKEAAEPASEILQYTRDINNEIRNNLKNVKSELDFRNSIRRSIGATNKVAEANIQIEENAIKFLTDRNGLEKVNTLFAEGRLGIEREIQQALLLENRLKGELNGQEGEAQEKLKVKIEALEKIRTNLNDQLETSKEISKTLDKTNKSAEEISKLGSNRLFGGLEDLGSKLGLSKFAPELKAASKASEDATAKATVQNSLFDEFNTSSDKSSLLKTDKFKGKGIENMTKKISPKGINMKGLTAGFKALGPIITKALGPISFLLNVVKAFGQANKETVELRKGLALNVRESITFRDNLASAADSTGDVNITASKLLESFSSLNKQFGRITNFANETLVTMTKLTKTVGISSEAAGNLAAASEATGTNFESNYKNALATSYELQRQSGVQVDLRDVLERTGKVTGQIRANLGSNPIEIAKAITQAKIFGVELEDIANAGKQMLDFESSITKELEAELLIGKNLNLEKARAAALAGDQVTLAQELQKQAGSFLEFQSMNVIQQNALAAAVGMTADGLSDALMKQEMSGKTAKELRALGKDELAERLESQTAADKFNATMEKLQAILVDVATAFMPILEIVGSIASAISWVIQGLGKLKILKAMGAGAATGAAIGSVVPGFGTLGGGIAGAVVGGISSLTTMDDGIVPAGYGETIIKKGKDTIALNNKDSVVVGTNLGGGTDMNETNQLLKMLVTQNKKKPEISPVGLYEVQ